jgi:hypothetical protein
MIKLKIFLLNVFIIIKSAKFKHKLIPIKKLNSKTIKKINSKSHLFHRLILIFR